ncbi:glyoxalase [bacterium]|nr:glyoxalase [bacterium]NCQ55115.1 glyoxalase [Candidatus Parcubacteria bacterium]NCS67372.1 glyoxalase [Candidatus Peregrinibacteria bacterium]NCS96627.1 glyoxalase [bacterium]
MKNTYLNLAIRNVAATDKFFAALGMPKNPTYASDDTTNAQINENTFVMLLEDARLEAFIDHKPESTCNNKTICLEFDTQAEVDDIFSKAISAGALDMTKPNPESEAFMYGKSFRDINGHIWEVACFLVPMPH